MYITVTMAEDEIIQAIKNFMEEQDIVTINKDISVNLVAGRGANGHSAVIAIKSNTAATPNVTHLGTLPHNEIDEALPQCVESPEVQNTEVSADEIPPTRKKRESKSMTDAGNAKVVNMFTDVADENSVTEDIEDTQMPEENKTHAEVESLFG